MSGLDGRVALVTGGSRGVGRAIARRLAADGAASRGRTVADTEPDEYLRLMTVHALGPLGLIRSPLPAMRARPRADIVVISSAITSAAPSFSARSTAGACTTWMPSTRSAGSACPRTSPGWSPSWSPPTRATSPASAWWSTAADPTPASSDPAGAEGIRAGQWRAGR
jgi:hypothetical protein